MKPVSDFKLEKFGLKSGLFAEVSKITIYSFSKLGKLSKSPEFLQQCLWENWVFQSFDLYVEFYKFA